MDEKMPVGVQIVRAINFVVIILSFMMGILMAMIAVPNFIRAAIKAGKHAHPIVLIIVGIISFAIGSIPAILLIFLNRSLKQLRKSARVWQIIVSCLMLLWFPIGTVLSLLVLYFLLFDRKTKETFETKI